MHSGVLTFAPSVCDAVELALFPLPSTHHPPSPPFLRLSLSFRFNRPPSMLGVKRPSAKSLESLVSPPSPPRVPAPSPPRRSGSAAGSGSQSKSQLAAYASPAATHSHRSSPPLLLVFYPCAVSQAVRPLRPRWCMKYAMIARFTTFTENAKCKRAASIADVLVSMVCAECKRRHAVLSLALDGVEHHLRQQPAVRLPQLDGHPPFLIHRALGWLCECEGQLGMSSMPSLEA